jgi:hypothetical protein
MVRVTNYHAEANSSLKKGRNIDETQRVFRDSGGRGGGAIGQRGPN